VVSLDVKSPEKELDEFLAARPSWAQKLLEYDFSSLTFEEWSAMASSEDWQANWLQYMAEYEKLAQRVPKRWREYVTRRKQQALAELPKAKPGAPRQDGLAEHAIALRRASKSYQQIADELNAAYGLGTTNSDAIRKLIASRKPEKT
jgi:hypothetical protein